MTRAPAVLPAPRPSGTDDITYGQLASARKAARDLLGPGALAAAEARLRRQPELAGRAIAERAGQARGTQ